MSPGPWYRATGTRRDGIDPPGSWVARSSIRLGPLAIDPPGELGTPGAFNGLAPLRPRDQGIDEAGAVGANLFKGASDQGGRSAIIPCSPVAGAACMAMVAGNQGTNMTS
jgi:hypothetical protein